MPFRNQRLPTRADLLTLLRLAAPIVLIQVGTMLMGVVDTIMVGRVSAAALAAAALGNLYFWIISGLGIGVLMALDPIVAQALGARDELAVTRGVQRGLLLSVLLIVPLSLALWSVGPVLAAAREPAVRGPAAAGLRPSLDTGPLADAGVRGAAADAARRTGGRCDRRHDRDREPAERAAQLPVDLRPLGLSRARRARLRVGRRRRAAGSWRRCCWCSAGRSSSAICDGPRPACSTRARSAECSRSARRSARRWWSRAACSATVALLMGWLGVIQVAAHQVAINLASLTFMVPLGVSSAAAVIVGVHAVGRGERVGAAVHRMDARALAVGAGFHGAFAPAVPTLRALPDHGAPAPDDTRAAP